MFNQASITNVEDNLSYKAIHESTTIQVSFSPSVSKPHVLFLRLWPCNVRHKVERKKNAHRKCVCAFTQCLRRKQQEINDATSLGYVFYVTSALNSLYEKRQVKILKAHNSQSRKNKKENPFVLRLRNSLCYYKSAC